MGLSIIVANLWPISISFAIVSEIMHDSNVSSKFNNLILRLKILPMMRSQNYG